MNLTQTSSLAGRRIRPFEASKETFFVGIKTLIAGGVAFSLLSLWFVGTLWYFIFGDELSARLLARQTQMQYAYEDRIGALRSHLDRVASQKLLEQDGLESRVSDIVSRQVQLETRHALLASLADVAGVTGVTGSIRSPAGREPAPLPAVSKPMPAPENAPKRQSENMSQNGRSSMMSLQEATGMSEKTTQEQLRGIDRSMKTVEITQLRALDAIAANAGAITARLRHAITEAGLEPDSLKDPSKTTGIGGPFVPLKVDTRNGPFEAMVDRVQGQLLVLDRLRRGAAALPFGRPMGGDVDTSSGFGSRIDPFTRGLAMHTGIDFRGEYGAPVRATAPGQVLSAEAAGGYGNMVEIDHGNGLTTRYAHLSAIEVIPGQKIGVGTIIGRVGSTGRSTGAHLHYETRIEGEAVDPQRFLKAGAKLFKAS